jgi:hypothetical protein
LFLNSDVSSQKLIKNKKKLTTNMELVIEHEGVRQRKKDGYVCATDLCKLSGKLWKDYWRLKSTEEYITVLSRELKLLVVSLVESQTRLGTWV